MENQQVPRYHDTPEVIDGAEHLTPLEIFRDGPRYYAARVTDGESNYIYKQAVGTDEYVSDADGIAYTPSRQLAVETAALRTIGQYKHLLAGDIPALLNDGNTPASWYLREDVAGTELGRADTPFFFAQNALDSLDPDAVAAYFSSLQTLGTSIPSSNMLMSPERRNRINLDYYDAAVPGVSLATGLEISAMNDAGQHARAVLLSAAGVLTHGEAYPPHILLRDNQITMIDWENTRLDHKYADVTKVWIRAFERPEWQDELLNSVKSEGSFDPQLWNSALLLDSVSLHHYLLNVDGGPKGLREKGAAYCARLALELAS